VIAARFLVVADGKWCSLTLFCCEKGEILEKLSVWHHVLDIRRQATLSLA